MRFVTSIAAIVMATCPISSRVAAQAGTNTTQNFFEAFKKADSVAIERTLTPTVELNSIDEPISSPKPIAREMLAILLSSLRENSPFDWQSSSCTSPAAGQTDCDIIFKYRSNGVLSRQRWSVVVKDGLIEKVAHSKFELVAANG